MTRLALLLLAAQATAPAPGTSPPPPVFPAGTELVTVDVVVVDDKREPIGGLTRQDFTVLEEGQPREIVTFEEVRVPEAVAPPPSGFTRPVASSNVGPSPARTFVIVFDELHLAPAAAGRAKEAIASFLRDGTRPGDRVILVPTGGGRSWTDTMPGGRDDLLALLDKLAAKQPPASGADHMTDWEALRIHVHRDERVVSTVARRFYENGAMVECIPVPGEPESCLVQREMEPSPQIRMKAANVYGESVARRKATLRALDAVMEALVPVKGRKSVLLVSQGFVLEPSLLELHGVYDAARRANAAIHFVDTRGLLPMETTVVEQGRATQQSQSVSGKPSNDLGLALDQQRFLTEGTDALAAETGGQSFKNSNDIARGFDLAKESTIYYLVGYAPVDGKRDGKFRRIEVKVARPRVEVRARRGYVVPREADLPQSARAQEPAWPAAAGGAPLPLRVATFPLEETGKGTVRVVIAAEADPAGFAWQTRDDRLEDALDTTLNVFPRSTGEVTTDSRLMELSLPAPAREQVERTWLPIARDVELAPGVYQAQLSVRERNTGRVGSVQHTFEVQAPGAFRVTAPILTDQMQPAAAGGPPRFVPLARRSFARGSRLYFHFDVLNAGRDAQSSEAKVRVGHVLRRVDGATLSRVEPAPVAPGADGRFSRTLAISLQTATPGSYEFVLTAHDDVAGRTVQTIEPFEVTNEVVMAEAPPLAVPATGPAGAPAAAGMFVDPRATLARAERLAGEGGAQGRRWAVAAALLMDTLGRGNDAIARLKAMARQEPAEPDALLALGALEESRMDALAAAPTEAPPAGSESLPVFQRRAARDRVLREIEARYRAVLAARPADAEARLRLGRVLQLRGDRQAVEHLQQVAAGAEAGFKALAFLFLGEWHERAGHPAEAVAAYRKAAAAAPHSQTATLALAQALVRTGDPRAARETVEKGLTADAGLDPFLTYERPSLRLGSSLVDTLEKEGTR